jgi:hypothetical protein
MFALDVAALFADPESGPATTARARARVAPVEEADQAAAESARWAMAAEPTNVGPHALEQLRADLERVLVVYPNRPVYPLFAELRELRNRAFELLDGRQHPHQATELYRTTGLVCAALAHASMDLGNMAAAETQARTALLSAELAGDPALQAWIRGVQSMAAYWDDRPGVAVDLAVAGLSHATRSGTTQVWLASLEARARARLGDASGTEAALGRAADAQERVGAEDSPGGMMSFPDAKRLTHRATARLSLGGPGSLRRAAQDASAAVAIFEADPLERRRLGELSIARVDLAAARLAFDVEGGAESVRIELDVTARRPTEPVIRRLRQFAAALGRPTYRGSPVARSLRQEIAARTGRAAVPAVTEQRRPVGCLRSPLTPGVRRAADRYRSRRPQRRRPGRPGRRRGTGPRAG